MNLQGLALPQNLLQQGSPGADQVDPSLLAGQGLAMPPQMEQGPQQVTIAPAPPKPFNGGNPGTPAAQTVPNADVPLSPDAAQQQFTPQNNIQAVVQSDNTLAIHRRNSDGSLGPVIKVVKLPSGGG